MVMFVLSLFTLLTISQTAHANLDFVYSVQRHGARNVLPKSALLTETDANGGPTLLPQGERQTYLAGECLVTPQLLSIILCWSHACEAAMCTWLDHMNVYQAEPLSKRRINYLELAIWLTGPCMDPCRVRCLHADVDCMQIHSL